MTVVNALFQRPTASGPVPAEGDVTFVPTRRRVAAGETLATVFPAPFVVGPNAQGTASFELAPTAASWAWKAVERFAGLPPVVRYLIVPDSVGAVEYSSLAEVDPATIHAASAPDPIWYAYTDQLKAEATLAKNSAASSKTAAEAAQAQSGGLNHGMKVGATGTHWLANGTYSNTATVGDATYRKSQKAFFAMTEVRLTFINQLRTSVGSPAGNTEGDNTNDITIKASVEVGNSSYAVRFNGKRAIVLEPGATITSDPLAVNIAKDATFYTKTYVSVPIGEGKGWPVGYLPEPAGAEGAIFGVDNTLANVTTGWAKWNCFGPIAVLGRPAQGAIVPPMVAIQGDSNAQGHQGSGNVPNHAGFIAQALGTAYPYVNLGQFGETVREVAQQGYRYRRGSFIGAAKYALCLYSTNDNAVARTVDQIKTDLIAYWTYLDNRGLKVYACTTPPRTTSTDGWATTTNQGPASGSWSSATNIAINDWIRTTPAPLTGYFDVADALETSRNSGIWKAPGYTNDGIHILGPAGINAAAGAINTAVLV